MPDHVSEELQRAIAGYNEIPFLMIGDNVKLGNNVTLRQYTNLYDCEIGDNTKVGAFVEIGGAVIGKNCIIGAGVFIPPGVQIGDNVFIGPHTVFTNDRWPRADGKPWVKTGTIVADEASIGANCTILGGVLIGTAAMIGAGAIIAKDVPVNAIAKSMGASHYCRHCHPTTAHSAVVDVPHDQQRHRTEHS